MGSQNVFFQPATFLFILLDLAHSDLGLFSSGVCLHLILNFILLSEVCGAGEMALWL